MLAAAALLLPASASAGHPAGQDGRVPEYESKATVLLNLFRFSEWPPDSFPSPGAPFVVCVVGADPFGGSLETVFGQRELRHRRFRIERLGEADATTGCHAAFISSAEESRLAAILGRTAGRPTLTVGDAATFVSAGGMVRLFTEESRVRISINEPAVRASGLRMSSLLLSLSRTPGTAAPEGR